MHQCGIVLHGLHKVRLEGVYQQSGHRALRIEFAHRNRRVIARVAEHDIAETLLEIGQARSEAEDRHDLRRNRDIESRFPHDAVVITAEPGRNLAQGTVVHIDHASPGDSPGIDIELILPVHVIVDQRGEQIVGCADRMKIAGKMQIDVGHRDDLRVAAAGRTALHAKARPQARLAQADRGLFADQVHPVAEANGRGGLALTGRGRRHGSDENQLAILLAAVCTDEVSADLRLVVAIRNQRIRRDSQFGPDFLDRKNVCSPCDLDI